MSEIQNENLSALFTPSGSGLQPEVLEVLEAIQRLHSINPQELFFKWESYCLKMGSEETKLDLNTARMFQKDVQDSLERSHQGRQQERKSAVGATPKTATRGGDNILGILDEFTPNSVPRRHASAKRKNEFETPAPKRTSRPTTTKPSDKVNGETPQGLPFAQRLNAGQVVETINEHLASAEVPVAPHAEARVQAIARSDIKKFAYKPMSMRISESAEVLDERIEEFVALVQKHHNLDDSAFGNAAAQSSSEIVAVGRIACDTSEGKLNNASLVLEMSRRIGAGLRVSLKVDALSEYSFFPGQIVALRGSNASGLYFQITEVLSIPQLDMPVTPLETIEGFYEKLGGDEGSDAAPLNVLYASGPYTADDNLNFEPLQALCDKAIEEMVDAVMLTGPFLDIEHPLLAAGDFDLPDVKGMDQDATMATLFRLWISAPLNRLCLAVPSATVFLIPSVRDAINRHVSWPQEQIPKRGLDLPKQVKMLPNPCFISLNEVILAISSHDSLFELSREQVSHGSSTDMLSRLPGFLLEQRHFSPLYPPMSREKLPHGEIQATGAALDVGYWKLGEWPTVKPDVLIVPSLLTPFVKVSGATQQPKSSSRFLCQNSLFWFSPYAGPPTFSAIQTDLQLVTTHKPQSSNIYPEKSCHGHNIVSCQKKG